MFSVLIPATIVITLIVTAYLYVKNIFSYWERRGIPFLKPYFPFGNFPDSILQKVTFAEELQKVYHNSSEPVLGIYTTIKPSLLVRDPEIVQDILLKNFSSFNHRGWYGNENVDPMAGNILLQNGEKWKRMRSIFSPAFTSGKLKAMFDSIAVCGESLHKFVGKFADTDESIEIREISACYATNVISSIAFGLNVDCITNPKSEFRKYGHMFFEASFKNIFRSNISIMNPGLAEFLRLRFTDKKVADFFIETVKHNLEYRETKNISRKDFFQLLIQLSNTGTVQDDEGDWHSKSMIGEKTLTLDEMAAQAFFFFIGGYESASTTIAFCMYELSKNLNAQERAYKEIVDVLEKYDGKISYESANAMKYIETCIDETLRMHPPFGVLTRKCTKDYKIPNSDAIIEPGTMIMLSVAGIHSDPKYYENPDQFIPDRFSDESVANKNFVTMPFLTFGAGPRNCLGSNMGKLKVKLAIIHLLQRYKFELGKEHINNELKLHPKSLVKFVIGGINLKVKSR